MVAEFSIPEKESVTVALVGVLYDELGNYGVFKELLLSKKPLNIHVEKPLFIFENTSFVFEIKVENNTKETQLVEFISPQHYKVEVPSQEKKLFKMQFHKEEVPFQIVGIHGEEKFTEKINPKVLFNGIKQSVSKSQYISQENPSVSLTTSLPQTLIKNSEVLRVCYTNSTVSMILRMLERFNQIPYGCFEQASTVNFPLVIALKILLRQKDRKEKLIGEMIENLKKGIELLMSYETKEGGFEWFG